jgi:hypothetical protein
MLDCPIPERSVEGRSLAGAVLDFADPPLAKDLVWIPGWSFA